MRPSAEVARGLSLLVIGSAAEEVVHRSTCP
jgi:nucleotide-binding universal stress UspA family protein